LLSQAGKTPFIIAIKFGKLDIAPLFTAAALARGPVVHGFPSLKEIAARNAVLLLESEETASLTSVQ